MHTSEENGIINEATVL